MRTGLLLVLFAALTACSEFPDLDDTVDAAARDAPYPDLIPVEDIRARVSEPRIEDDTAKDVEARAAGLKARAARLKNTPIN